MKIFVDLIISSIGFGYYIYGKKNQSFVFLVPGVILMFYSYFTDSILTSGLIGIILGILPFVFNRFMT